MPFDEDDDLLTGLDTSRKRPRRPSNPLSKVLDIARADNIPEDIANDFTRLIKFESGASHYDRRGRVKLSPPDPRTGERAVGAVQIKPSTAREVGINNPFDEDENIRAGLRYFAAGGADPVARRIRYFGGPGAQKHYQRTGRIPKGGDVLGTSFQDYVRNTSGGRPQRPAAEDDLITGLAAPEIEDDLLTGLQGQTPPKQINRDSESALQPASTPQQSVPVSTGRFGAPQSRKFSRPLRPPRPKQTLADMVTGGVGVVAPPGVGELRRLDDPATQQITRIQRQVTAEQTPAEREMRRAPGTQNARLLEEKLTENEEVIRRLEQEQDTAKREAAAAAEAKRLMAQFTRQDKAEIADFVNHLKGKGSTYTGIRTGARAVGASGLYKLAGLTDIANAVQKPLTGQDSWIPDFLKRKALAGELSIEEIPVEQRGQVAEFLTQLGLGLAEIAVAPGGPVGKFAGLSGTESIGRGQSAKEIAKETAKGATVGAVFKAAPMLNKPAQTVRGRAANLAREGAGIGAGTYAVERGFGTPADEAALSAATNVALHGVLGARRLRGRKQDAGQAEAQRQGVQTEQPVEAVEGQPVVSKVEAPQKYQHLQFGEVTAAENQTGVSKGHVRVIDQAGAEHVIQRPNLRGQGNQQAVPIKERIEDAAIRTKATPETVAPQDRTVDPTRQTDSTIASSPLLSESRLVRPVSPAETALERDLLRERSETGQVQPVGDRDVRLTAEVPPVVEQAERRRIQREFDKIKESETAQTPPPETVRVEPEAESTLLYHGRGRAQDTVRAGSMLTSQPEWAAGYTTKVNPADLSERFVGKVHEVPFSSTNVLEAKTLHDAEQLLIDRGRTALGREPSSLQEAAEAVHKETGADAIVVKRNGVITDAISLVERSVSAKLEPQDVIARAQASGVRVPDNLVRAAAPKPETTSVEQGVELKTIKGDETKTSQLSATELERQSVERIKSIAAQVDEGNRSSVYSLNPEATKFVMEGGYPPSAESLRLLEAEMLAAANKRFVTRYNRSNNKTEIWDTINNRLESDRTSKRDAQIAAEQMNDYALGDRHYRPVKPSTPSVSAGAQLPERGTITRGEPKVSEQPIKEVKTSATQKAEVKPPDTLTLDVNAERLGAGAQGTPAREAAPAPSTEITIQEGLKQRAPGVADTVRRTLAREQEKGNPAFAEDEYVYTRSGKYVVEFDQSLGREVLRKSNDISKEGFQRALERQYDREGKFYGSRNPKAQEFYEGILTEKAKAQAEKDAIRIRTEAEIEALRERQREYDARVEAVVLPPGKKQKIKITSAEGVKTEAPELSTVYGDWAIRKQQTGYVNQEPYVITHVPSGMSAGTASHAGLAKNLVKAYMESGLDASSPKFAENKEAMKRLGEIYRYMTTGGGVEPPSMSATPEPSIVKAARSRKSKRAAEKAEGIEYRRAGADPYELIDNITIKGWDLYSQKVKPTFEEWSKKLREEFGPESETHLRKVWVQLGGTEPSSTAAKREKVTADRAARGEEPIPRPERKSDEQLLSDAKAANLKDPNEPLRLVDQVLKGKKGALSDKETVQVDLHVQELKNKYDAVNKKLAEAKDPATIKELSEQSDAMEREMRSAEEAFAVSGTEKGRALRAQRIEIDQDFRLLTMISRATKAHGRELTRDERATIKEQHDKIAELETKLTEANERVAKAEAERAVGRIKSDVAKENRRAGRRVKRESLDQEAAELKSLIAQAWKRQSTGGEIHSAMGLAKLDPEGEVTKLVVQLAKNRIQAKVGLKAEALVDEVHGLLKDVVDLNRREVAEMISGYGKTYELSKDAVDVRLRELKSIIAANLGKADIIEKGIRPLRRGLQRDKPTQEVRAAMRELRDTLREHGMRVERSKGSVEEQQQSALDAAKTRTKNRIEDLSKWIKDGKRTVANKTEIIPDAELKTLQAERDRLQKVFEAIVDPAADLKKIENSLRSVNKSIVDLEAKIRAGNIAAKPREKGLTSPELEAARAEQKALRGIISDLRKAAKPQPTTPEIEAKRLLSANKALNTRMEKQIADLERRMKQGDFSKPEKREPVPFSRENLALQKQLEQVKQAYARANYKATRSRFGQISDELAKAANVPKTLKSMGDISAVFRQGGFYSLTHPVAGFAKPTAAMLRAFTETGFRNVEQAIKNHPKFEQARRDGVEFTGVEKSEPNLSKMEESFFGSETIDVLATGKYNPLRAVKASKDFSQRTFVSFLDSQRMNMYDVMSEGLKAQGLNPRSDPASYKGIAKLINIGTGRGNLGKTGNQAAPLLNIAMFSPRLVASRVQLLNNMFNPVAVARMPKGVREQNVKDNVKFLAATAAFMGLATAAGATVNRDPDDADFLKIRFGNTTYDTLTGLQQPLRYIINMTRAATMGETYPGQGKAEMTKKFARSKASPSISPIINWVADEDFMGRKFSLKREAGEIVLPLPAKDFWEAMEKEGLIKGFLKATPALTGIGVQTYEQPPEKPKTAAEKLARKFVRDRIPDVAREEEEIERSEKKAQLRSRARKGEDVKAEVEALGIPERQQKSILAAKGMTRLQEDFKRLGLKEALAVYSVMTRGEQQQVKDILATKAMTVDNLSDDEQTVMNKRLESIGLTPPPRSQRKRPQRPSRPSRSKREGYQWTTP